MEGASPRLDLNRLTPRARAEWGFRTRQRARADRLGRRLRANPARAVPSLEAVQGFEVLPGGHVAP